MCCRKKANPLNLMNRDWKSERGREERREARRRARAMNSSPCSKETKCWKEKGDKQRWRERKGKKKRWSYPRRCKHNKKSKEKYQKKGGEKERGENEGSTRVNMRKSASAFSPSTHSKLWDWKPRPFRSHTNTKDARKDTHTPEAVFVELAGKPLGFISSRGQIPLGGG